MAKFVMTESTEKMVENTLGENFKDLETQDAVEKLKDSKKFVINLNENGEIEVKLLLLD